MNCKQARGLFSSRLDGELRRADGERLLQHLAECTGCASRWSSFESTVRMLRTLPAASPDPSFIGNVLDRVRAYEAGTLPVPHDSSRRMAWPRGVPSRIVDFLSEISWSRVLVPARLAGVAALGALVGTLAMNHGRLGSGFSSHGPGGASQTVAQSAGSGLGAGSGAGLADGSTLVRPFADLARKLQATRPGASSDSTSGRNTAGGNSARENPPRESNDALLPQYQPNDPQSLGRTVHLDQPDGRPQIIF